MIIHTICKWGETVDPKVSRGWALSGCEIMMINSKANSSKVFDRENVYANWKSAFKYRKGDIFIGMDSDVVLREDTVKRLLNALDGVSFAFYPTDIKNTHGIWAARKEVIKKVIFNFNPDMCPICLWRENLLKAGYKNRRIFDTLETVNRKQRRICGGN